MGLVNPTQSSPGETIEASDVNTPVNQLAAAINGNIETANIADGAITPAKLVAGTAGWAYASTTPTYVNFTLGNGTVSAFYQQTGKRTHYYGVITLGSTSAVSGQMDISLPVNASGNIGDFAPIGTINLRDTSANAYYPGKAWKADGAQRLRIIFTAAGGTYSTAAGTSSTAPFTWTTNDLIFWDVEYEAA